MRSAPFTVAYWCVLLAVLLPLACAYLAKLRGFGRPRSEGGYDNDQPRAWLARQEGWQARADAAQANSFESLPFFIGAVLIAHQVGAPQPWLDILAVLFVTLRILYVTLYVVGLSTARSVVWALAFLVNVGIFLSGWH